MTFGGWLILSLMGWSIAGWLLVLACVLWIARHCVTGPMTVRRDCAAVAAWFLSATAGWRSEWREARKLAAVRREVRQFRRDGERARRALRAARHVAVG